MSRRSTLSLAVFLFAAFAATSAAEARRGGKSFGFSGSAARDIGPNAVRVKPHQRPNPSWIVLPTSGSARGRSGPVDDTARTLTETPDLPATAATPAGPALVNDAQAMRAPVARGPVYGFREVTGGGGFEAVASSDRPFGSPAPTPR